jgi:GTPase
MFSRRVSKLLQGLHRGDRLSLSRTITLLESRADKDRQDARRMIESLVADEHSSSSSRPTSLRIGFSGPPGVGKSSFIDTFGSYLVSECSRRVAVLAVDPSSQRTGGSILGDKTRMQRLAYDDRCYVRPSPSRGSLGGVTRNTSETIAAVEAAGFDVVIVETVGVGQSETAVDQVVDVFVLLASPGGGDELQGIKKGIMELADIIVVNKADGELRATAMRTRADYANALRLLRAKHESWKPRALACSAHESANIDVLWRHIGEFRDAMSASGELAAHRQQQRIQCMWAALNAAFVDRAMHNPRLRTVLDALEQDVREQRIAPGIAADQLFDRIVESHSESSS